MEFDVNLEGVIFRVFVASDELGFEVQEVYAQDSKIDISYFMDSWHGAIENEILRQLGEMAMAVEEESFENMLII